MNQECIQPVLIVTVVACCVAIGLFCYNKFVDNVIHYNPSEYSGDLDKCNPNMCNCGSGSGCEFENS